MQITEEDLNNIAIYAIVTGLDPERRERIEACECKSCIAAAGILRLVGDRIETIIEAEGATKN